MTNLLDAQPTGPAAELPPPGSWRPGSPPVRSGPAVRFLWKLFAAVMVLGLLLWAPFSVITLLAHEERVEREVFPATGLTTLEVDGGAGNITITAAETDDIAVRAAISDGLRATGESRVVDGSTLRLRSSCPNIGSDWCRVHYDVTVPAGLAVVVTNDTGRVEVSGVTGPVRIANSDGSTVLTDLSGDVRVRSRDGSIRATGLTSRAVDTGRATAARRCSSRRRRTRWRRRPTTATSRSSSHPTARRTGSPRRPGTAPPTSGSRRTRRRPARSPRPPATAASPSFPPAAEPSECFVASECFVRGPPAQTLGCPERRCGERVSDRAGGSSGRRPRWRR